jgi:hypothetical protein
MKDYGRIKVSIHHSADQPPCSNAAAGRNMPLLRCCGRRLPTVVVVVGVVVVVIRARNVAVGVGDRFVVEMIRAIGGCVSANRNPDRKVTRCCKLVRLRTVVFCCCPLADPLFSIIDDSFPGRNDGFTDMAGANVRRSCSIDCKMLRLRSSNEMTCGDAPSSR